jgi:hypothetical protein
MINEAASGDGDAISGPEVGLWPVRRIVAIAFIMCSLAPLPLGAFAYVIGESSESAWSDGLFAAAWASLPLLVLAGVLLPMAWNPARRFDTFPRRRGIITGLVLAQVLWWFVIGSGFVDRRDPLPRSAQLAEELGDLWEQEEIHRMDRGAYAHPRDVGYVPSSGRFVLTLDGAPTWWSARVAFDFAPEYACVMYMGEGARPQALPDGSVPSAAGEMLCDPALPGSVGEWLLHLHSELEFRRALAPF